MPLPHEAKKEVESGQLRLPANRLLMIFVTLAGILAGVAGYIFLQQSRSIEKSDLTNGKVIRLELNNEGLSAPIIEYEWRGQKWLYASHTYSKPPAYEVNEIVPIYVNREDPNDIIVDTISERWMLIIIFGVLSVFFAGIPLLALRFTANDKRNF